MTVQVHVSTPEQKVNIRNQIVSKAFYSNLLASDLTERRCGSLMGSYAVFLIYEEYTKQEGIGLNENKY